MALERDLGSSTTVSLASSFALLLTLKVHMLAMSPGVPRDREHSPPLES